MALSPLLLLWGSALAQQPYSIYRAPSPVTIDAKLDEPAWREAPSVGAFQFNWHTDGEKEQTIVKMLWDDKHLYIAHVSLDDHIAARHRDHDGKVAEDDCFEIMLAPDPDKPDVYFNIEWNVVGGYVDNHRPNGPKQPRAPKWDAEGIRIAGSHNGTLNDDHDTDGYWIGEVAIPLRNFAAFAKRVPPAPGTRWNGNFNRHGGATNMQYSQWSAGDTEKPAFHTPHRFGMFVFSAETKP